MNGRQQVHARFYRGTMTAVGSLLLTSGSTCTPVAYKASQEICQAIPFQDLPVSQSIPFLPCVKKFTKTNRRRYIGQQPGTKSGRRPADKRVINRRSTGFRVLPSVYMVFPLSVLPGRRSGQLSSMPWRAAWSVVSWANRSVGVPNCLAPPRPATAVRRPAPTRPWYVRVLDSTRKRLSSTWHMLASHSFHQPGFLRLPVP